MAELMESLSTKTQARRKNALTGRTRCVLWARAAGRCEYEGCNKVLIGDLISGCEDKNFGFVAHIIADTPSGPRGDVCRSPRLSGDIKNLMLLCATHHKLIDVDEVEQHSEKRLLAMKDEHETRVEIAADIMRDRASHVLRYAATIGDREVPIAYSEVADAMLPEHYPAEGRKTIDIDIRGTDYRDHEGDYWQIQCENLRRQFSRKVQERVECRDVSHLSVFALAPQPLLIELGRLVGDIVPADVYQLHREPRGWRWQNSGEPIEFQLERPRVIVGPIALVLVISATVSRNRVIDALGQDAAMWTIQARNPHNDAMKWCDDLRKFRQLVRGVLNEIKARVGENETINLFPVLPVSAAVEVGRVWMPKADLPLVVYDQNRNRGGFFPTIRIS